MATTSIMTGVCYQWHMQDVIQEGPSFSSAITARIPPILTVSIPALGRVVEGLEVIDAIRAGDEIEEIKILEQQ